jgi:hypothetical protein
VTLLTDLDMSVITAYGDQQVVAGAVANRLAGPQEQPFCAAVSRSVSSRKSGLPPEG